jgi:hypothetical protein
MENVQAGAPTGLDGSGIISDKDIKAHVGVAEARARLEAIQESATTPAVDVISALANLGHRSADIEDAFRDQQLSSSRSQTKAETPPTTGPPCRSRRH